MLRPRSALLRTAKMGWGDLRVGLHLLGGVGERGAGPWRGVAPFVHAFHPTANFEGSAGGTRLSVVPDPAAARSPAPAAVRCAELKMVTHGGKRAPRARWRCEMKSKFTCTRHPQRLSATGVP